MRDECLKHHQKERRLHIGLGDPLKIDAGRECMVPFKSLVPDSSGRLVSITQVFQDVESF